MYAAAVWEPTDQLRILYRLFCIVFYQDCHEAFQTFSTSAFTSPFWDFCFFFLVSLPIDVDSYKESTAIHCAKLESMNRKVSSFISAVSIGVWRITKDSMNNMNNLKPWKTGFWKGSETACQLACISWDSHFPTLLSPISLQLHHCERRKRTTPFSILCVFLCQQLEMLSLSSFLSFHLCKFLH